MKKALTSLAVLAAVVSSTSAFAFDPDPAHIARHIGRHHPAGHTMPGHAFYNGMYNVVTAPVDAVALGIEAASMAVYDAGRHMVHGMRIAGHEIAHLVRGAIHAGECTLDFTVGKHFHHHPYNPGHHVDTVCKAVDADGYYNKNVGFYVEDAAGAAIAQCEAESGTACYLEYCKPVGY